MQNFLFPFKQSFLDFFYPPLCLACYNPLETNLKIFCQNCLSLATFTNPLEHCKSCYQFLENSDLNSCPTCQSYPSPFALITSPFLSSSPFKKLTKSFSDPRYFYLLKACASLMTYHYLKYNPFWPDYVTYIPLNFHYNASKYLATYFAKILKIPLIKALKKDFLGRLYLNREVSKQLENKTVLLIHFEKKAMKETAFLLGDASPKMILGKFFSLKEVEN